MKKTAVFLLCFVLSAPSLLLSSKDDMFGHIPFKSGTWKTKTTVTEKNSKPMVMTQSVQYKNGKMRTDGERTDPSTGKTAKFSTIIDGATMCSFDPDTKKGMKMKLTGDASGEAGDLAYSDCRKKASKSGSAKINGVACDIFKYTCNLSGTELSVTEWRAKKDGFIMKTESISGGHKTTVEVAEVKPGASVPDSVFATRGLELVDMDNMMGGAMMKQGASKKPSQKKPAAASDGDEDEDVQKAMEMFKGMFGQ